MSNSLTCPLCGSKVEFLSSDHPEYTESLRIKDGTVKWYICSNKECSAVLVRDKLQRIWQYSPKTYDRLVSTGYIKDKLL